MSHPETAATAGGTTAVGTAPPFTSLVRADRESGAVDGQAADPEVLGDLRLHEVIAAVADLAAERDLVAGLLSLPVRDLATVEYRHEVFADLEDAGLRGAITAFAGEMRQVRAHLASLAGMRSPQQRAGWFLDAAAIYCDAVRALGAAMDAGPVGSRGLLAFRGYLSGYLESSEFAVLAAETAARKDDLAQVRYLMRIRGSRVEVSRYEGEPDYSTRIEQTFARFRQGAVKDYRIAYRTWPGMDHVGERVLALAARLFSEEFTALARYCRAHASFLDQVISQFEREVWFYLAYLDYIGPLRSAGLRFCLPEVTAASKEIFARDTFDLALAARLVPGGTPVVPNDVELSGPERVIVVSGPNQGGKTTFARTFGQLHHLACTGCPVPGTAARLYQPDQIYTHFGRVEDIASETGKLEDDLLRIQRILRAATPRSVVILNEIFSSTTLDDARFLGGKVLAKVTELGLLCVFVTFVDELASFSEAVVSMASTIVPEDPAQRTYKVVRKPADGLAYALAIAAKHRVTYDQLRRRVGA